MQDVQNCFTQNPIQVFVTLKANQGQGPENAFEVFRNADPAQICSQSLALLDCLSQIVFAVPLACYDQITGFTQGLSRFSVMTAGVNNLCSATNLPNLQKYWQCFTDYELAKETFGCVLTPSAWCKADQVMSCVGDKIDQSKTCPPGARDFNERVSAPFLTLVLPPDCIDDDSSDDDDDDDSDDNGISAVLPGAEEHVEMFLKFFK
jgi:hypothetical protein